MDRLDQALVERGLCESREKAKRAIMAGSVMVNGQVARKPSDPVAAQDELSITAPERFVSRGGYKLEHALTHFQLDVTGLTAVDFGASTGGFTDCLLQHGAAKVYAIDVGQAQLAWKLRRDRRVVVMEKTNARDITPARMPRPFTPADVAVIDCSFISLHKVLPPAVSILKPGGRIVALIKPQFEAGKTEVDKGEGVITDPAIHERVLNELEAFVREQPGLAWLGVTGSPPLGPAGNKEFNNIKRVGLIGNSEKVSCAAAVTAATRLIRAAGRQVYSDPETSRLARIRAEVCADAASLARQVDLLLVFGGDGTMLRVAREIAGSQTPMLGVNIGGLGFLTAVPSTELARALNHVWKSEFKFEARALLEAHGRGNGRVIRQAALNDLVISRGIASRLIELHVSVDGEPLTRYRCDGLIISSPTGSTAYSLAAGGAVVFPTAEVLQLTPICPHTLSNRSLVLPLNCTITVKVINPTPVTILSADGQVVSEMSAGDEIVIRRSRRTVRLMHLEDSSFFETLRVKLHWRGANL
jgi:TlyA family rRNA methyltransferase/putative hemolysin